MGKQRFSYVATSASLLFGGVSGYMFHLLEKESVKGVRLAQRNSDFLLKHLASHSNHFDNFCSIVTQVFVFWCLFCFVLFFVLFFFGPPFLPRNMNKNFSNWHCLA